MFRMPKIKIPKVSIPNPIQAIQQAVAPATNVINTVIRETPKAINVAGQQITDGAGNLTSQAEQFARNSINSVHGIGVSAAGQAKVGYTRHGMWTAKVADAALGDIDAGSKLAIRAMEQGARAGVYGVTRGGDARCCGCHDVTADFVAECHRTRYQRCTVHR